jgi:hypothetical protein
VSSASTSVAASATAASPGGLLEAPFLAASFVCFLGMFVGVIVMDIVSGCVFMSFIFMVVTSLFVVSFFAVMIFMVVTFLMTPFRVSALQKDVNFVEILERSLTYFFIFVFIMESSMFLVFASFVMFVVKFLFLFEFIFFVDVVFTFGAVTFAMFAIFIVLQIKITWLSCLQS